MVLSAADIASLDLTRLVYLENTRAGSLRLESGYYYVNKIANYAPGVACPVSLTAV